MSWVDVLNTYGIPGLVGLIIAYILYKEGGTIVKFLVKRAERKQQALLAETQSEVNFDDALREQVLDQQKRYQELIERIFQLIQEQEERTREQLQTERLERTTAVSNAIEGATSTVVLSTQAVEVMQDFADIARMLSNRTDRTLGPLVDATEQLTITSEALLLVLTRLYFKGDDQKGVADLLKEIGK